MVVWGVIPVVLMLMVFVFLKIMCQVHTFSGNRNIEDPEIARIRANLMTNINVLAGEIGPRHIYQSDTKSLKRAVAFIVQNLNIYGTVEVTKPECIVPAVLAQPVSNSIPVAATNIVLEKRGTKTPEQIIIIGAHYDTVPFTTDWEGTDHRQFRGDMRGTPGADDNASGVAALMEMARLQNQRSFKRTVRYVAFANEEPPNFEHEMGSVIYAKKCLADRENIFMMISLDALGVYSRMDANPKRHSAASLLGLTKDTDYVVFMSNWNAKSGFRAAEWARTFAKHAPVDVRTCSLPFVAGEYFAWSDDWSFTREGYPAFTATDTAFYRTDRYHELWDTPQNISLHDYDVLAGVVLGLAKMVEEKANQD